ncbi:TonB-dependent receptor [Aliikangiella coralliicola]|uniref:TonB-dependent receptor n=2 Tax=Aliikangiella coralliicola TaxID=2592383 RepID=A0A545UGS8_9GAMM|nr:TonB-dependent receptor [Aliikangiella coralliicola]
MALLAGSIPSGVLAAENEDFQNEERQEISQEAQAVEQDETIEEVVVTGSRLQGSAQAVLDERKEQAFVADILGSEQISRTGDGDAASALRRVTGLTLVDGKFIYIRGLGERYSATQLNAMTVPSPDPTRSVLPLDLFPSAIIESLNVQKAYSPDLPAHFAGGNVNIRTKSIPNERIIKLGGEIGTNSDNSGDSPWYEGGGDDWKGMDDGTRELPAAFAQAFAGDGINRISNEEAVALLGSLNRNIDGKEESVDPNVGLNFTYGDKFDFDSESELGFLASFSYKNKWQVGNERNVNNLARTTNGIEINEFSDGPVTEHNVKFSGMVNIGFNYNESHKFEFNNIFLRDTRDRLRDRLLESTNTINEPDDERRQLDILYEEREMFSHQLKGSHNFADYKNLGVDWYYSKSDAERFAPGGLEAFFRVNIENGVRTERLASDVDTKYLFQDLKDDSENYGINFSIPFYFDNYSVEFKAGADFIEKDREAENIEIAIQTFAIPSQYLQGGNYSQIFSDGNLAQSDFTVRLDDQTSGGDKYKAATLVDAYYFMADFEVGTHWRFTGGVRYEDFRQVSIPFQAHSEFFDVEGDALSDLAFMEDEYYPSIAATYILDSEMQFRFNYSQTAIRPDLRDISTSFYIDPLTEFLVRGSTSLESANIDNFDLRWEWYLESGENLSVAFFAKDIETPIEMIELPSATEGAPQLLTANADQGELYGIEVEFLKDFSFLGDDYANYFASGNFTLSDSEVSICSDTNPQTECLFEEQLKQALNTNESVTSVITNNTRRLIGHSEWVVNLQFGWDSLSNEHSATLVYNVFGPRIIVPGVSGFEDAEEKAFHSLDFVYTWYPTFDSTMKVKVKNLLDEEKIIEQESVDILRESVGTEISLLFSTNF